MINNSTSVCKFNFPWPFSHNIGNEFMSIWGEILIYISHLCLVCVCERERVKSSILIPSEIRAIGHLRERK